MRRQDDQARIAHVHQRRHHEFRRSVWISLASRRAALVAVGERGLVPVMAVGDQDFLVAQRLLDGGDGRRIGDDPKAMEQVLPVGGLGGRPALLDRVEEADDCAGRIGARPGPRR